MNTLIVNNDTTPRQLVIGGEVIAEGGDSNSLGLYAQGVNLMFDGDTICEADSVGVGLVERNGEIYFGNEKVASTLPQGLREIIGNSTQWYSSYPSGWPISTGAKQGAAIYGSKWFQFYAGGHVIVYNIISNKNKDLNTKAFEFNIPTSEAPDVEQNEYMHISSAKFSNTFYDEGDDFPLVYLSWNGVTGVYRIYQSQDLWTASLIRWWYIDHNTSGATTNPAHGAFSTFDFTNGKGYAIGYPEGVGTGSANHKAAGLFEVIPYTFPTSGTGNVSLNVSLDTNNRFILDKTRMTYLNTGTSDSDWSNLQDSDFSDGHIYILFGGTNGGTDSPKILDVRPNDDSNKTVADGKTYRAGNIWYTSIKKSDTTGAEGEGISVYGNGFIISALYTNEHLFVP